MSLNQQAQEVVDALLKAVMQPGRELGSFLSLMEQTKPSAEVISRAIVMTSASWGGMYHDQMRSILGALLQHALTREHVAAQEGMSIAANGLQKAAQWLSVISLLMTLLTFFGLGVPAIWS